MKKILFYVLLFLAVIVSVPADTTAKYDDVSSPEHVILSFENAINMKDFYRAWNYWKPQPGSDFEKWKKDAKDKVNKLKHGLLTEDEVYEWLLNNK